MMKFWRNLLIFIGIIGFFSLVSAVPVSAQYMEKHRESLSEINFLKNFGGTDGQKYVSAFEGDEDVEKVTCGNPNTMCDKATQVCLKCEMENFNGLTRIYSHDTYGYCAPKEALKAADLWSYWKGNKNCKNITSGKLSVAQNGFIDERNSKIDFTKHDITKHTFPGADGKNYRLIKNGDNLSIAYANAGKEAGAFTGCEVFPVKAYKMQGCFYCPIANIVFNAAEDMTGIAFFAFAQSFKVILVIVFAIWLVLMSANYAFSMTKQDAPKFLTSVLLTAFKIALAYYLLTYSLDIFRFFIRPILEAGLALGEHIQITDTEGHVELAKQIKEASLYGSSSGYYGSDLHTKIEYYLTFIQSKLAYMQALGSTIFCVGSHRLADWKTLLKLITLDWGPVIDALRVMFLGGFFTVFGFLLTIAFGFYFIDAIIQLIVIGAMIPFMIATWPLPFGQTKYASKGFEMLINVFFIFFMTGFVICVCLALIDNSLATAQEIQGIPEATKNKESAQGFQAIIDALYDQNWEKLNETTTIGVSGFLLLVFSAIFGFQFVGKATEIAGKLSAGIFQSRGGLAGRVGTMAYSTAKGFAGRITSPLAEGVADTYHEVGGAIGMAGGVASKISKPADWVGDKLSEKLGGTENAGKTWSDKNLRGKAGAIVGGVFKAPGAISRFVRTGAKKVHSTFRHR